MDFFKRCVCASISLEIQRMKINVSTSRQMLLVASTCYGSLGEIFVVI